MDLGQQTAHELRELEKLRRELPEIGNKMMNETMHTADNSMNPLLFIVMGVVKRCLSISHGIDLLVRESNMTCARALVRMQLDTVLRFGAFWLSDHPQKMVDEFMAGKAISKMKDREGNLMTDSYLVKKLGEHFPWIPEVYKYTSGYIHFSERQLYDPIHSLNKLDNNSRLVTWAIHEQDTKFPETSWVEVVHTASLCLEIVREFLLRLLETWRANDAKKG